MTPSVSPTKSPSQLCGPCRMEWEAWLDYRITVPITIVQIGSPSAQRIVDERKARFIEWRNTIRSQQELIVKFCSSNHK